MAAVDLQHLRQFTADDAALEAEVLMLFVEHGARYLAAIAAGDREPSWRIAAHSLKGSARGVGAHGVAREAELIEKAEPADLDPSTLDLVPLNAAFKAAQSFIEQHLAAVT
jgi:HPt (histidine-containing phosphotransfer) domain-containing protein